MSNVAIPEKILTSKKLAVRMAHLTKKIKENIINLFKKENKKDSLHKTFLLLQKQLINELKLEKFADIYAQSIVYGLFSIKVVQEYGFSIENILKIIPDTELILKTLLEETTRIGEKKSLSPILKIPAEKKLNALLNKHNIKLIIEEFKKTRSIEDPIIHFYELFLKEYAPKQRFGKGVFYTPEPVVSFIVRSVDYLLRTELGFPEGLADSVKLSQPFKKQIKKDIKVKILDPAIGTGTFLTGVIEKIKKNHDKKYKNLNKVISKEKWNEYVSNDLLPRIIGFELMLIPYMVAHLKIGLKLSETGYNFKSNGNLRIHLANALESKQVFDGNLNCSVIIGNPPYSGFSSNRGKWITDLVRDYYYVDGKPLDEKNPKWLLDDYVKFIRFGQWCINRAGFGILAFITNHGYLDNPTFRGMRENLMKDFPLMYICNLHGNSIKKEISPDGSNDECVFDIKQGICIGFFIKPLSKVSRRGIYHVDVWGTREEKFNWLRNKNIEKINWNILSPISPFYLFVPQQKDLWKEYQAGIKLTNIFKIYSAGIATARDHFTIQWTKEDMLNILRNFVKLSPEEARKKYKLRKDVRDWKVRFAQKDVIASNIDPNLIVPIQYRPFDIRHTYYTGKSRGFLCMPRPEVMKNMLAGENIGLSVSRSVRGAPWRDVFSSTTIIEFGLIATRPGNTAPLFPLYLFENQGENICKPNLTAKAINRFSNQLGLNFISNKKGNLINSFGPKDIFHYIYAILHSQEYRNRYAEYLKMDFPYIPITRNAELFKNLVKLGNELILLHTLNEEYVGAVSIRDNATSSSRRALVKFIEGKNGKEMGRFNKDCFENGKIYINQKNKLNGSYFIGIPTEVWNFHIGSYQVCYKWLYDKSTKSRKKGKLLTINDIDRFIKMVVAINETIRIMDKIDHIIENYGGWPLQ